MNANVVSLSGIIFSAGSITNRKRMGGYSWPRSRPGAFSSRARASILEDVSASYSIPGALLVAGAILFGALPNVRAEAAAHGSRFAVATEDETTTKAAIGVLRAGGSAVDAAVTAA